MMIESDLETQPLSIHFQELQRVIWVSLLSCVGAVIALFCFSTPLLQWITSLAHAHELIVLSPIEGFFARCKIALWGGFLLTLPFWIGVFLVFIAPSLFSHEKRIVFRMTIASMALLGIAVALFFAYTFPWINAYLMSWNEEIAKNAWSLSHYLDYLFFLLLGHIALSQFILILYSLVFIGVVSAKQLAQYRKPFILTTFILSAILTPPDVLTQCLLAFPTLFLYEGAYLYSRFTTKGKQMGCSCAM